MLSQEDWNKAYMTHDYKKLIEGSGLKLGYIADLLKMSRQTLWAKLNGKSRFTEQEATNLETVICMAPLCANGEYDIGEARHLCGLDLCEEGADEENALKNMIICVRMIMRKYVSVIIMLIKLINPTLLMSFSVNLWVI